MSEIYYSYSCTKCGINWPHENSYIMCRRCHDKLDLASVKEKPLTPSEAESFVKYVLFERYLEERPEESTENPILEERIVSLVRRAENRAKGLTSEPTLFDTIIQGAGFNEDEVARILDLEKDLNVLN